MTNLENWFWVLFVVTSCMVLIALREKFFEYLYLCPYY